MVPNRTRWHQQIYQRLPGEEQAYSLRWLEHRKNMLGWLAEGRNIKTAKTTRMTTQSSELGGVKRIGNTLETMKHWKSLI
jgi:hypothetical protein